MPKVKLHDQKKVNGDLIQFIEVIEENESVKYYVGENALKQYKKIGEYYTSYFSAFKIFCSLSN